LSVRTFIPKLTAENSFKFRACKFYSKTRGTDLILPVHRAQIKLHVFPQKLTILIRTWRIM